MFVPDREKIIQVKLHAEGLGRAADELFQGFAQSFVEFELRMTKQRHYDFGLRAILFCTR